jgi:choloylglycine hydrolase
MSTSRRFARIATWAAGLAGTALLATTLQRAEACTGIVLPADDGGYVRARTMEFARDLHSEVIVVPRGYARRGTTPDGSPGLSWQTRYASVGANALGLPVMVDGLNEAGLSVGLFYFPGSAGYMSYRRTDAQRTIAPWELGSWLLDNFADVDEVRARIADISVVPVALAALGTVPPLHYMVSDANGRSLVLEYVDGALRVYNNPLGVLTNSPGFDWQTTNLRNYLFLSPHNPRPGNVGAVEFKPFGEGAGALGLPGDFTPPSRFVRAAFFVQSAVRSASTADAVTQAFHLLNNFDIPMGSVRQQARNGRSGPAYEYTLWTSAADMKARRYYFRTYADSRLRMIDLSAMAHSAPSILRFSMAGDEEIRALTSKDAVAF